MCIKKLYTLSVWWICCLTWKISLER